MLRVNIEGKKSMGQFSCAKPENKVIAHKMPTKQLRTIVELGKRD